MKHKILQVSGKLLLVGLFVMIWAGGTSAAAGVKHAIIGSVQAVDKAAKTIVVKTADGTMETVKWTSKTTVRGLKDGAKGVDFVGREGSHVVVHYTIKGAEKTASTFEYVGRETPKVAVGTIKVVGKGTKKVVVVTGEGAEEVFDLSKRAVVLTGEGVADATKFVAKETFNGAKVTVHYTEVGGRKLHFIKRL